MASSAANAARIPVASRAEWRAWLRKNGRQQQSVWVVSWKKGDPRYVAYGDLVEEALCFGWIDSLPRKLDASRTMLLMAPRKAFSAWSRLNKQRAEKLIADGSMTAAGLRVIAAAKAAGLWTKLDGVEDLKIPPDLQKALRAQPGAKLHFDAFPRSAKRGILEWILQAKRAETRAKRIAETAQLASRNVRANQWPR
jgi:uncharacterized protein YdeI (YjbR/CyaY-like superfamily)